MKISYQTKNLRKLRETPEIEMRPLTILVGRNSAGKSTFLRSFPLLRQSIETKASAPVLWWGDYVDFGNFNSSVWDRNTSNVIEFNYFIENFKATSPVESSFKNRVLRAGKEVEQVEWVRVSYGITGTETTTRRKHVRISTSRSNVAMELLFPNNDFASQIKVGDVEFKNVLEDIEVYLPNNGIFESPLILKTRKDGKVRHLVSWPKLEIFHEHIANILKTKVRKRLSSDTIRSEARKLLFIPDLNDEALGDLAMTAMPAFAKLYKSLLDGTDIKARESLNNLCRAAHLFEMLESVSLQLTKYYSSIEYIGPARARSERFYRQQELQVSDISPDGRNLPMFLASIGKQALLEFSQWVERKFGYGVHLNRTGAHISIELVQDGANTNVIDTGYGVSQVLPVLAQIWWMGQRKRYAARGRNDREFQPILAIEQPELHLHPAHQALLAEIFTEVINDADNEGNKISLIIETHSEAIINKIGELIFDKKVDPEAVQIVVFGGDEATKSVQLSTFDECGVLQNWPHGFFSY